MLPAGRRFTGNSISVAHHCHRLQSRPSRERHICVHRRINLNNPHVMNFPRTLTKCDPRDESALTTAHVRATKTRRRKPERCKRIQAFECGSPQTEMTDASACKVADVTWLGKIIKRHQRNNFFCHARKRQQKSRTNKQHSFTVRVYKAALRHWRLLGARHSAARIL